MATIIKESTSTIGALNANSTTVDISDADVISVQIHGTFVGTISFYGSQDGTTFYPFAMHSITQTTSTTDTLSAGAAAIVTKPCASLKYFKTTMTAYTSGTATVNVVTSRYGK